MPKADVNRAYFMSLSSPEGKHVMEDMNRYASRKLMKKDKQGRVDPFAMAFAAGQRDLFDYIEQRIEDGKLAR